MTDYPLPDLTRPKSKWSVGTLTYTAAGLAVLFALLLWGDFAWSMKDRVVFPMTVKLSKERFGLNDTLYSILIISFPNFTNIFLMPIVSYLSDRHRGRLGRRIPFLLFTTPFIVVGLLGIGMNAEIGRLLEPVMPTMWRGVPVNTARLATLVAFCIFWVLFDFGNTLASAIFNALVNDVVPQRIIGRFFSLFRIISLLAGILYNYYLFEHALEWFKWIFLILGVLYAAGLFSMCFFVKEGQYPPPEAIPADKSGFQRVFGAIFDYFRQCFSVPYYRWIIVALLLANISFHPINDFSIQYAKAIGVPDSTYGQLLAITYCFSIVLSYPLGALADRFHPIRTSFISLAAYAFLMLVGWLVVGNPWQAEFTYHIPGLMSGSKTLVLSSFAIVFIIHGVVSGCFFTLSSSLPLRLFPGSIFAQFASANAMILALGTTIIVPAFGFFLDVQESNYHLLFLLGAVLSLISALAFVKIHLYYKRFGGDEGYVAPDVMTKEGIAKAGDTFRTFLVHGAVAGVIAGCLLGYWFESPQIRQEYSWGGFYRHFLEVIRRPSREVEEWVEVEVKKDAKKAEAEAQSATPETAPAETETVSAETTAPSAAEKPAVSAETTAPSAAEKPADAAETTAPSAAEKPADAAETTAPSAAEKPAEKKLELKRRTIPAPLMPWLLSVITFALIGAFFGSMFPDKRRPVKRGLASAGGKS